MRVYSFNEVFWNYLQVVYPSNRRGKEAIRQNSKLVGEVLADLYENFDRSVLQKYKYFPRK